MRQHNCAVEVMFVTVSVLLDDSFGLDDTNYSGEWLSVCTREKVNDLLGFSHHPRELFFFKTVVVG